MEWNKQLLIFIALCWLLFFLALGGSQSAYASIPSHKSTNWEDGLQTYVINTRSVPSMRQAYADMDINMISWAGYSEKLRIILNNACRVSTKVAWSKFIAHVINDGGELRALCISATPTLPVHAKVVCIELGLLFFSSNPLDRKITCVLKPSVSKKNMAYQVSRKLI